MFPLSEKVKFRSQILVRPSIGESWNSFDVPVLPENVIFTFFRMCWCYSEAYNTGTQKWFSIVQYSCTSIWDFKYTFPHFLLLLLQILEAISSHIRSIYPTCKIEQAKGEERVDVYSGDVKISRIQIFRILGKLGFSLRCSTTFAYGDATQHGKDRWSFVKLHL